MPPLLAHEKWFLDPSLYPLRWDLTFRGAPLLFLIGTVAAAAVIAVLWHLRRRREIIPGALAFGTDPERLAGFYGLVPAMLGAHLAVTLLVAGVNRNLFSPNVHFDSAPGYLIGPIQVGIALCLFYGTLTRLAALLIAALWCAGILLRGPQVMLDNLHILGYAAFFFLAGRGPFSIDRLIFPRFEPAASYLPHALPALRIGLGLGLITVAFTEKFANLPMALDFLNHYPVNFTHHTPLPLSHEHFILCAGSTELLIGLLLTFNLFPRTTLCFAWIPFTLTLSYFNWNSVEFIGHLPIYAAVAVLLLWAPNGEHDQIFSKGLRDCHVPLRTRKAEI